LKEEIAKKKTSTLLVKIANATGDLIKSDYKAVGELELAVEIQNQMEVRSPEIESVFLISGDGWSFTQEGIDCAATLDKLSKTKRHFVKCPITRIAQGAWAPINLKGKKQFWSKYSGEKLRTTYEGKGHITLEINTSEGTFKSEMPLEVNFTEFPF
jgi:hypothetical protein